MNGRTFSQNPRKRGKNPPYSSFLFRLKITFLSSLKVDLLFCSFVESRSITLYIHNIVHHAVIAASALWYLHITQQFPGNNISPYYILYCIPCNNCFRVRVPVIKSHHESPWTIPQYYNIHQVVHSVEILSKREVLHIKLLYDSPRTIQQYRNMNKVVHNVVIPFRREVLHITLLYESPRTVLQYL